MLTDLTSDIITANTSPNKPCHANVLSPDINSNSIQNFNTTAMNHRQYNETRQLEEKQAWIKNMRLEFCHRPEFPVTANMIHPDGMLNQA